MSHRSTTFSKKKACENCRRRKIKCDGVRPSCSACTSNPSKFGDCEYAAGPLTRSQRLLNMISHLQTRLANYEQATRSDDPSSLSPSSTPRDTQPLETNPSILSDVQPSRLQPLHEDFSPRTYTKETSTALRPQDSLRVFTPELYELFLRYSLELGFFLEPSYLRALLWPENSIPNPIPVHPALHSIMHLWSTVIYYPTADIYEQILLPQVMQSMAFRNFNVEDFLHRTQFLHYIQAGILLAQYFFRKGNLPEGKYHVAGAVSLVLDARLHQHAGLQSKVRFNLNLQRDPFLEEQELINAFWGVLTLSNMWSTATAGPFLDFQSPAARVDIPWPSDLTIECPGRPRDRTILRFLTDTTEISDPDSILTLVAKAAILWLEATKFTLQYDPTLSPLEQLSFSSRFQTLDAVTRQFIKKISPQISCGSLGKNLILGQNLCLLALILLHKPFITQNLVSYETILSALRSISRSLVTIDLKDWQIFDPIFGIIWRDTSSAIIFQVNNCSNTLEVQTELLQLLENLKNIMKELSRYSESARLHAEQIEQMHSETVGR